jgi:release factor glutamine methyltransferase
LQINLEKSDVVAIDLSKEAIELAKINALHNTCNISFINDSILEPQYAYSTFDIIVSNPPYVRESEKVLMSKNVIDYEPLMALFVEDSDPLIFYKAIAEFASVHLLQNGKVYCEINEGLGNETADVFKKVGFKEIQLIQDLNNKDRFLKASNP